MQYQRRRANPEPKEVRGYALNIRLNHEERLKVERLAEKNHMSLAAVFLHLLDQAEDLSVVVTRENPAQEEEAWNKMTQMRMELGGTDG